MTLPPAVDVVVRRLRHRYRAPRRRHGARKAARPRHGAGAPPEDLRAAARRPAAGRGARAGGARCARPASSAPCGCGMSQAAGVPALMLGPLAVDPWWQGCGVGAALMRDGAGARGRARPWRGDPGGRCALLCALRLLGRADRGARPAGAGGARPLPRPRTCARRARRRLRLPAAPAVPRPRSPAFRTVLRSTMPARRAS